MMKNSRVPALLLAISLITTSLPAAFAAGESAGQSTASSVVPLLSHAGVDGASSFLYLLGTLLGPNPLLALMQQPSESEEAQPVEPAAPALPDRWVIDTPYISQVTPVYAPVGCEPTSLLMGLKAKGYAQEVDLRSFLDAMPKHEYDPAQGFAGSPYQPDQSKRTTIYPAKLAEYGRKYGDVADFSGRSVEELQRELLSGNPVVVYVTLWWAEPYYRTYRMGDHEETLLRNNHAVLLCGYDSQTDQYNVADPYNVKCQGQDYFYWQDASVLEPLYLVRQHAVVVR